MTQTKRFGRRVTIHVKTEDYEALRLEATTKLLTPSDIIRQAIEQWVSTRNKNRGRTVE